MTRLDLSLSGEELDDYLREMLTLRLATAGPEGPHVVPLWYVWHDGCMFVNTTRGNVTVRNLERDARGSAVVDDGETYDALRGAVVSGPVEPADEDPRIAGVKQLYSGKYHGGGPIPFERWRNRLWLRLTPERVTSWDFRKIPEARARRGAPRGG